MLRRIQLILALLAFLAGTVFVVMVDIFLVNNPPWGMIILAIQIAALLYLINLLRQQRKTNFKKPKR